MEEKKEVRALRLPRRSSTPSKRKGAGCARRSRGKSEGASARVEGARDVGGRVSFCEAAAPAKPIHVAKESGSDSGKSASYPAPSKKQQWCIETTI
eukprot:4771465-Pleurochrysis_carterae.AAC.2